MCDERRGGIAREYFVKPIAPGLLLVQLCWIIYKKRYNYSLYY